MHTDTPTHAQHGFTYARLERFTAVTSAALAVLEVAAEEEEEELGLPALAVELPTDRADTARYRYTISAMV